MYIHSYINIICFQLYITSSHPCGFLWHFFHVFFSLIKSVKSRLNTKNIVHYTFIIISIFYFIHFSMFFLSLFHHNHFSFKKNEDQLFSSCIHRVLKRSSMKEVDAINQCLENFLLHYFFTSRINKLRNWRTFLKKLLMNENFLRFIEIYLKVLSVTQFKWEKSLSCSIFKRKFSQLLNIWEKISQLLNF